MNILRIFVFIILFPTSIFSQVLTDLISLDTIINTHILASQNYQMPLPVCLSNNNLLFYVPPDRETDSLKIRYYNLTTKAIIIKQIIIPDLTYKVDDPQVSSFAIEDNSLILHFKSGSLAYFHEMDSTFSLAWMIPFKLPIHNAGFQQHHLLLTNAENYLYGDPKEMASAILCNFDPRSIAIKEIKKLEIKNIEFSSFPQSKWIDFTNHYTGISQTTDYKIDIYDSDFNKNSTIERNIPGWHHFSDSVMFSLRKQIPRKYLGVLLDSLKKSNELCSRVEGINFVNDSILVVRYIIGGRENIVARKYDIWKKNSLGWYLSWHDLLDRKVDSSIVCTKTNYPLFGAFTSYAITSDFKHLVGIRVNPPPFHFNYPYQESYRNIDNYFRTHPPEYFIYQYSINEKK
jgi:hypothetical protein